MEYLKNNHYKIKHIVIIPIVTSLIIPLIIFDIWVELYHRICFPLYKLPFVKRSAYIKLDRFKLPYLTFWQKMYCAYCGYGRGLVYYWKELAAQTEKYWCGISEAKNPGYISPEHQETLQFAHYGDEINFQRKYVEKI